MRKNWEAIMRNEHFSNTHVIVIISRRRTLPDFLLLFILCLSTLRNASLLPPVGVLESGICRLGRTIGPHWRGIWWSNVASDFWTRRLYSGIHSDLGVRVNTLKIRSTKYTS